MDTYSQRSVCTQQSSLSRRCAERENALGPQVKSGVPARTGLGPRGAPQNTGDRFPKCRGRLPGTPCLTRLGHGQEPPPPVGAGVMGVSMREDPGGLSASQ